MKNLMGKKVYDKNAIEIGKINDLEINTSTFTIEKIYIKAGMTKQFIVSPDSLDRIGDTIFLAVKKDDLG